MDEMYTRIKGEWYSLYFAVDKYGQTINFQLTEHRERGCVTVSDQGDTPQRRTHHAPGRAPFTA